ncbi:hypothetical protein AA0229_1098 [Gluconobacter cerinus NRIC 0229]|nr:hypothetical protein AA0229_1098 [Gluconobacter cerinus NRIC 0229]
MVFAEFGSKCPCRGSTLFRDAAVDDGNELIVILREETVHLVRPLFPRQVAGKHLAGISCHTEARDTQCDTSRTEERKQNHHQWRTTCTGGIQPADQIRKHGAYP